MMKSMGMKGLLIMLSLPLVLMYNCTNINNDEIKVFSESYRSHVEMLSSDEFEGRAPTTKGGRKAKTYIENEFRRVGLKAPKGSSFRQMVPLVEISGSDFSDLIISTSKKDTFSLKYKDDMVVGTTLLTEEINIAESEIVFAGFGIVAPEYNWNDYKGLDVKGKTVLVIINDPGYYTEDESIFTGKAMTYYGRWTYKYEEAARQGAAGILIIHESGGASYGWDVVKNSWSGPQYQLGKQDSIESVEYQGWIQQEQAEKLFQNVGLSFEKAKNMAVKKGFKPFSLKMSASVNFKVSYKESESANIIGFIEGSEYPEETIIYMAHWDHLGRIVTEDGIQIYHGAVDNATGVAALISIAEKFTALKTRPKRSLVFIALTAEESGLLGSLYYAMNPIFPIEKTVGGINMDGLNVYGPTHDVSVIGYNTSELQEYLLRHAENQNRVLIPDRYPERGSFYRSDHFNLVRVGVPMIYANSGKDFIGKDEEYAAMVQKDYAGRYHAPTDVINELWDWTGIYQNLWLFFNIGNELANNRHWPAWKEGNEFKNIREASDSVRMTN
jgi:Zn-dependent M28 family amino/carboxypeptidase